MLNCNNILQHAAMVNISMRNYKKQTNKQTNKKNPDQPQISEQPGNFLDMHQNSHVTLP